MLLAAPMMPHLAEEAWHANGFAGLIADAHWPPHDPALLVEDQVTIAIQHMGKLRDTVTAPRGASQADLDAPAPASTTVLCSLISNERWVGQERGSRERTL